MFSISSISVSILPHPLVLDPRQQPHAKTRSSHPNEPSFKHHKFQPIFKSRMADADEYDYLFKGPLRSPKIFFFFFFCPPRVFCLFFFFSRRHAVFFVSLLTPRIRRRVSSCCRWRFQRWKESVDSSIHHQPVH
jgi:hypothetical protein